MKITSYDNKNDIIYIELSKEKIAKQMWSEDHNVITNLNEYGNIVGIEIFGLNKLLNEYTDSEKEMCECKGKGYIGLIPCPYCNPEYFK